MNSRIFRVLSIKPFRFLFLSEIFSQIGINMLYFVLIILAYKLLNSNIVVAGIVLCFTVPAIIFGLLAGVFVDRWKKKNVLFVANAIRALLIFLLIFFHNNLLLLYLSSLSIAIATQFVIPSETPMVPLTVEKSQLLSANALFGTALYGSLFVAYALSGPLFLLLGNVFIFLFLSFLFLIAVLFISIIHIPRSEKTKKLDVQQDVVGVKKEMRQAISVMVKTKKIYHALLLLTLSQIIILILAVVGPGYARQILGISVDSFPLFFITPAALGMGVGALVIGNYFHSFSKEKSATLGVLLSGITILLLPYGSRVDSRGFIHTLNSYLPNFASISILHFMVVLAFFLGVGNALVFVPANTMLQESTDDNFRGKVYGALNALIGIFSLIPIIMVGSFSDIFGVGKVLSGIGIAVLLVGLIRLGLALKH